MLRRDLRQRVIRQSLVGDDDVHGRQREIQEVAVLDLRRQSSAARASITWRLAPRTTDSPGEQAGAGIWLDHGGALADALDEHPVRRL